MSAQPPRDKSDAAGVPARRAAMRLLDAVLRRGLPLEAELERAGSGLPPADRALAHAIAAEALRWLADLDALIDGATAKPLPADAKARFALRLALAQSLRLGTPGHAAIATILPLLEGGPRRLVHGVFGTLSRRGAVLPEMPTLPESVAARWLENWGADSIDAARAAIAAPPPLDLSLKDADATGAWTERLGGTSFAPGHVRVARAGAIGALPGFDEGAWWVQDVAASVPARLIGGGNGRVLDLCAAPGGKTLQLAAAGWQVTALDNSEPRIARLRDNLVRSELDATIVNADAMRWEPDAVFDAVLLDAPCSATGIFRRHPDVLHRTTARLIAERAELQAALLARAAAWVRPGGRLVYAVCSLEPEEGEAVLDGFFRRNDGFQIEPAGSAELPQGIMPDDRGCVRVLPGGPGIPGGADGFFIARLKRAP